MIDEREVAALFTLSFSLIGYSLVLCCRCRTSHPAPSITRERPRAPGDGWPAPGLATDIGDDFICLAQLHRDCSYHCSVWWRRGQGWWVETDTRALSRNCDTSKSEFFVSHCFQLHNESAWVLSREVSHFTRRSFVTDILLMTNLAPKCSSQKIDKILATWHLGTGLSQWWRKDEGSQNTKK